MFPILHKRALNASVSLMEVEAPYIARKARAGRTMTLRVLVCLYFLYLAWQIASGGASGTSPIPQWGVVALTAAFAAVALVVALVEMVTVSHTGIWGFLMNFIATASFCCVACFVYKKHHTMKGAVIGLILGVISLVIVMLLWNYLITPIYQKMPREAIVDLLLPVFLPFNAVKGGMNLAATLLLYKPVVTALRRAKLIPESDHAAPPVAGKKRLGVALVSLFVLATFVLLALVLAEVI